MPANAPLPGKQAVADPIRILVVDDSVITRSLICRWLESDAALQVVGTAADGRAAIQMLSRHKVDILLLDIEMPVLDGLSALPELLRTQPGVKIIMASSLTRRNAQITLRALELGAVDYLTKPSGSQVVLDGTDFRTQMIEKVKAHGADIPHRNVKKSALVSKQTKALERQNLPVIPSSAISLKPSALITIAPKIIALGCSTGGPNALNVFFSKIARPLPIPIVIVQHMPPIFTDILAQQISRSYNVNCTEARDGEILQPGHIYIAPGDYHMRIKPTRGVHAIVLSQDAPVSYCRPAVDPLFISVAEFFGENALGVVLTGMGKDGLRGAEKIRELGGDILVQDEASSVVWGMPGAVAKAGLASEVIALDMLADAIEKRLRVKLG
jgi:two-component system, chemotaxis family, protein-glutamate methylesterase/glutaminase